MDTIKGVTKRELDQHETESEQKTRVPSFSPWTRHSLYSQKTTISVSYAGRESILKIGMDRVYVRSFSPRPDIAGQLVYSFFLLPLNTRPLQV